MKRQDIPARLLTLSLVVVALSSCVWSDSGQERDASGVQNEARETIVEDDFAATSMQNSPPTSPGNHVTQIPAGAQSPCAYASCQPRDVSGVDLFWGSFNSSGAAYGPVETASVEDVLDKGLRLAEASPTHLAFRGTAQDGSLRCGWRGIARTPIQRERASGSGSGWIQGRSSPPPLKPRDCSWKNSLGSDQSTQTQSHPTSSQWLGAVTRRTSCF